MNTNTKRAEAVGKLCGAAACLDPIRTVLEEVKATADKVPGEYRPMWVRLRADQVNDLLGLIEAAVELRELERGDRWEVPEVEVMTWDFPRRRPVWTLLAAIWRAGRD